MSSALLILHNIALTALCATALRILCTALWLSFVAALCYYLLSMTSQSTDPLAVAPTSTPPSSTVTLVSAPAGIRIAIPTTIRNAAPTAAGVSWTLVLTMAHAATGETRSRLSPVTTTVVSTIGIVLGAVFLHMTRLLTLTADDLLLSIHPVRNSLIVLKARLPVHIGVVRLVPLTRLTAALVGLLLIRYETGNRYVRIHRCPSYHRHRLRHRPLE